MRLMNNKCIYECERCVGCGNYYPIDGEYNDLFVDKLVEDNREEFMSQWYTYVSEYAD